MATKSTIKTQPSKVKDLPVKSGKPIKGGVGCPAWICGDNHNETLVRD